MAIHPRGGAVTAWRQSGELTFWHLAATSTDSAEAFATPLPQVGDGWGPQVMTVTDDGQLWLIEDRLYLEGELWRREPSRLLRHANGTWEEVRPLADATPAEPVGLTLDPDGRLVVHLRESTGIVGPAKRLKPEQFYGDAEWIARQDGAGGWDVWSSADGVVPKARNLLAATRDAVWMSGDCRFRLGSRRRARPDRGPW